jgi:hypothetical protein
MDSKSTPHQKEPEPLGECMNSSPEQGEYKVKLKHPWCQKASMDKDF